MVMMKIICSLAVICILNLPAFPQSGTKHRFFCAYGEDHRGAELCSKIQASPFNIDESAATAVEKVLSPLGLKPNFVLFPCENIDNAAAVAFSDGIRYIVYNRTFMKKVAASSPDWASLSIVAHEIGHHLLGHTEHALTYPLSQEDLKVSRTRELDADEFSGFIMYKLKASLPQAKSAMVSLPDVPVEEMSTHPKRLRRLAAIETGYKKAEAQQPIGNVDQRPSAEGFYSKGRDAVDNKNYNEALNNFTAAIAVNPNYYDAYFGRAYSKTQGFQDYKGALEDYTTAIRLKSDYAEAYFNRGRVKSDLGDQKGAIEDYTVAIRLDPSDPTAYYNRGYSKHAFQDYTGAIEDYTTAIRLDPNDAKAYVNRAISKSSVKDFKGAIDDSTTAIRLRSNDPSVYFNRGKAKSDLGDIKGAIEDYTAAIKIKPDYAIAYFNRGFCKDKNKDYRGAIEDYTTAMRLEPNDPEVYFNRGSVRDDIEDYKGAIEDFTAAIRLKTNFAEAYFNRAYSKNKIKDYRGAIEDYTIAIYLEPNDASAYLNRGYVREQLGDTEAACEDFRKSCSLRHDKGCAAASNSCKP